MKRLLTIVFLAVVLFGFSGQAFGQCCPVPGPGNFPQKLQQFLKLSDKQIEKINEANQGFQVFLDGTYNQYRQIEEQITLLGKVDNIDAVQCELGGLYVQLFKLNNAINAEHTAVQQKIVGVLNSDQLDDYAFLKRAIKNQEVIYEALSVNLLLYSQQAGEYGKPQSEWAQSQAESQQPSEAYRFFAKKLNW